MEVKMAESRLVPTNILSWPRISGLLPDQKLIFLHLWINSHTNSAGCYLYPINSSAGELSLSIQALGEALVRFKKDKLIDMDIETGEILVVDWFRFHKFSGVRINLLENDIKKIQSERLKKEVIIKSECYKASKAKQREDKAPPAFNLDGGGALDLNLTSLVEAAVWKQNITVPIKNVVGFTRVVSQRIKTEGVNKDDLKALSEFNNFKEDLERKKLKAEEKQVEVDPDKLNKIRKAKATFLRN